MQSRRRDERVVVGASVKVAVDNGTELDAILLDYTAAGVGLVLPHSVRRGAPIKLIMGTDQLDGIVGRCTRLEGSRGYSVGVQLGDITREAKDHAKLSDPARQ